MSSAYLRLLIFLPTILIPACNKHLTFAHDIEPGQFTTTLLILFIARSLISEFSEILANQLIIYTVHFFFHSNWKKNNHLQLFTEPEGFGS